VPKRAQDFIFINFYSKRADSLFQYTVHTLRLIVEHNIRQMSPTLIVFHHESAESWRKTIRAV